MTGSPQSIRFYADHPTVPFELLSNRTSLIGYATTFLHGISALALFYFRKDSTTTVPFTSH